MVEDRVFVFGFVLEDRAFVVQRGSNNVDDARLNRYGRHDFGLLLRISPRLSGKALVFAPSLGQEGFEFAIRLCYELIVFFLRLILESIIAVLDRGAVVLGTQS